MKISAGTAVVMTVFATFFWGSNFHATKIALSSLPPWTASVERFILATAGTFAILLLTQGLRWSRLRRNLLPFIILGVIGVGGFTGSLFVGLQTSHPITAALIMATTPISANILEALVNRRAPSADRIVGMIVSLFGTLLVITKGQVLVGHIEFAPGDLLILGGSVGWAVYTVGIRASVVGATPLETTTWTMLFGTIVLGLIAFLVESPATVAFTGSASSYLAILWMGIGGSILAYLFWNVGIAVRGPGKTAILFNFVPIFTLLIEIAMGTMPHFAQIAGVVITIFGVLIAQGRISIPFFSRQQPAGQEKGDER